jgi:hypothetical protein
MATAKARRQWLNSKHKLGTNSAWWISERAAGKEGEDSPGKTAFTHRVELTSVAQIDAEVKKWLKTAYDLDGAESSQGTSRRLPTPA